MIGLPHIKGSQAGRNKWDPVHKSIFEVAFTVPESLRNDFSKDEVLLTEHVLTVAGLDALTKAPETGSQKFMGTTRTYINPTLDDTSAEITIKFSLNLRDDVDDYILKLFKAWSALGYDIATGSRSLKRDYCADWLKINIGTRDGSIIREVIFKDVMLAGPITGLDDLDYSSNDAAELEVKFKSDWWNDTDA